MDVQRTAIYIDGFNFYYGQVKGTPWKWLNLEALFRKVLGPKHSIAAIHYFTARVQPTPKDPNVHTRQAAWLDALQATSAITHLHFGHFLRHRVRMEHVNPPPASVEVWKTEEKGSDVNLAVHVLNDAWLNLYDCAIVVSNDSDLAESLRLVKKGCGKQIGLITPGAPKRKTSWELKKHADFIRSIRPNALASSLLPDTIAGTSIHKPAAW